jgi:DNA-binding transcriptional ArsR family regulator
MNHPHLAISKIAAAVGEPARTRILYSLMDGQARTSTELAVVAGVSPSTASVHLNQLKITHLVNVLRRGKYRYYFLEGPDVAQALEALAVLPGGVGYFVPSTPSHLRDARTCYDHMAGRLAIARCAPSQSVQCARVANGSEKQRQSRVRPDPGGERGVRGPGN